MYCSFERAIANTALSRLSRLEKISLDKIFWQDSEIMHFTAGPTPRTPIIEICLGCRG